MVFLSAFLGSCNLDTYLGTIDFISKDFLGGVRPVRNCSRLLLHYAKRWIYIRKTKADNCSRRGCNINIANR